MLVQPAAAVQSVIFAGPDDDSQTASPAKAYFQ
jgi:hypothetical protein